MMTHERIQESLPKLAAGTLEKGQRHELEEHVSACAECREWLETYRLLDATLTPTETHPQADNLARFALQADADDELDAHLASCGECRREIELSRRAVAFARDGTDLQRASGLQAWWRPAITGRRLALAAAVLLVTVAAPFLTWRLARPAVHENYDLSGTDIGGVTTIAANSSITAAQTEILSGAQVTLVAGNVVAFGEGFSVADGASLAIEIRTEDSL